MGRIANRIFDNDSGFGRAMTRVGILVGANLAFAVFTVPIVTIGPALGALYFVMFRILRSDDGVVNPFKEFWKGFRLCFKQGIIYWLILLALVLLGWVDVRFSAHMGGILEYFRYAILALGVLALVLTVHFYPVLAAFNDTLPHLIRNAVFFAGKNIFRAVLIAALHVVPLVLTYLDQRMMPLYGFLWVVIGYAAVAMISAKLLFRDFEKYLPPIIDPRSLDN